MHRVPCRAPLSLSKERFRAQALATTNPEEPLQTVLGTTPLTVADWGVVLGLSLAPLGVVEAVKGRMRRLSRPGAASPPNERIAGAAGDLGTPIEYRL